MRKHRAFSAFIAGLVLMFVFLAGCVSPASTVKADTRLKAPSVKSVQTTSKSITIKWKKIKGAKGYKIYKYDSLKNTYVEYATSSKPKCKISGLDSNKTYKIKVSAYTETNGVKTEGAQSKIYEISTNKNVKLGCDDFMVYDAGGKSHKLSDYAGKPIVVNMWATWCPPCCYELPGFDGMYKEYMGKVQFLMINVEESTELSNVKDFIKENKYSFPVFYDWDYIAGYTYGTEYIPQTIIINSDGEITYNEVGMIEESDLKALIDAAM